MTRELADFYQEIRHELETVLLRTKLPTPMVEDICVALDKRIADRYEKEGSE